MCGFKRDEVNGLLYFLPYHAEVAAMELGATAEFASSIANRMLQKAIEAEERNGDNGQEADAGMD
jgi:hypothetical protein